MSQWQPVILVIIVDEVMIFGYNRVKVALLALMAMASLCVNAQFLRSSYFMESVEFRQQLNPALVPDNGYVHLPAIGGTGASVKSNSLGMYDVYDLVKNIDDDDHFTTDAFVGKLKDENRASLALGTDILSVGTWRGKGFMSFNASLKCDGSLNVARTLFSFLRDMKGLNSNDYSNYLRDMGAHEIDATIYTELGFGYTRIINDHWTVGARVKGLLGMANMNFKVNRASVQTHLEGVDPNIDWTTASPDELVHATGTAAIDVDADLVTTAHGLDLVTNGKTYIDDVKFHWGDMGIAGFGAALDLGLEVNVTRDFSLSAAVTDLGFIHWGKGQTTVAHADTRDLNFNSDNLGDIIRFYDVVGVGDVLNFDMLRLTIDNEGARARNTRLASTMALGGQYKLLDHQLKLGVLFTNRFALMQNDSELTFSVGYRPRKMLDLALSYSPIMCGGQSFGLGMKLGPLFLGADYIYMGNKTKCCNAMVGLSIPLMNSSRPDLSE